MKLLKQGMMEQAKRKKKVTADSKSDITESKRDEAEKKESTADSKSFGGGMRRERKEESDSVVEMNVGRDRDGSENDGESSSSSDDYDTAKSHEKSKSGESFQALPSSSSSTDVEFVGVAKFQPINPSEMDLDVASSVILQSDGKELCDGEPVKHLQWPWSNGGGMKREQYESDEESRSTFK